MTAMSFEKALEYVLHWEGGLSENIKDPGGITNFGISLRFLSNLQEEKLRIYGIFEKPTADTIKHLTKDQVIKIYYGEFWTEAPFFELNNQNLCNYIFDFCVNSGTHSAIKCIQKINHHLIVDGIMGKKTFAFLNLTPNILDYIKNARIKYYENLVKENPHLQVFLTGWLKRATGIIDN